MLRNPAIKLNRIALDAAAYKLLLFIHELNKKPDLPFFQVVDQIGIKKSVQTSKDIACIDTGIIVPFDIKTNNKLFHSSAHIYLYASGNYIGVQKVIERAIAIPPMEAKLSEYILKDRPLSESAIFIGIASFATLRRVKNEVSEQSLKSILYHEVTHLSDPGIAGASDTKILDFSEYINRPAEIKARINEYISRINDFDNLDDFLRVANNHEFRKYVTDKNHRIILSTMYSAWDQLHGKEDKLARKITKNNLKNINRIVRAVLY